MFPQICKVTKECTDVQVVLVVSNRVGISVVADVWPGLGGRPNSLGAAAAAARVRSTRPLQQRLHAAHIRHACLCARLKGSSRAVHCQIKAQFVTELKTSLNWSVEGKPNIRSRGNPSLEELQALTQSMYLCLWVPKWIHKNRKRTAHIHEFMPTMDVLMWGPIHLELWTWKDYNIMSMTLDNFYQTVWYWWTNLNDCEHVYTAPPVRPEK